MKVAAPQTEQTFESLVDLLECRARMQPNVLAYKFLLTGADQADTITYSVLANRAKAIAAKLQKSGILPGDRAMLVYEPGIELIVAFFGCLYAGVIGIPVYPPTSKGLIEKLERFMVDAEPVMLLVSTQVLPKLQELKLNKEFAKVEKYNAKSNWNFSKVKWEATDDVNLELENDWRPPLITANNLAFLQYTSGSTGHPKGVMVSHGNLLHNLSVMHKRLGDKTNHITVCWVPPYHDLGLIAGILQPFFSGWPGVLMNPMKFLQNPFSWLQAISDDRATLSYAPNFAYDYCAKKVKPENLEKLDLSCWEIAQNGAEPIYAETCDRFYEAFKSCGLRKEVMFPGYGIAEATLAVSSSLFMQGYRYHFFDDKALKERQIKLVDANSPDAHALVSCGTPLQDIRIVNPKTLELSAPEEMGEIWINSPSVTQGYWQRKKETEETFHARIKGDESGTYYLRTGDLGFFLDKELYVAGRIKDIIIIHGVNHYPQDIEYTVSNCHPQIRIGQCVAFSSEIQGEERLMVVCEVDRPRGENVEQLYLDLCQVIGKAIVQEHEIPVHTIALIPPRKLPKTTSGKVRRRYTKELLLTEQLPLLYKWIVGHSTQKVSAPEKPMATLTHSQLEKDLCAIYGQILEKPVSPEDNFFSLGGDSLLAMQLLAKIQSNYQIEIPLHEFFEQPTISDLAKYITKLTNKTADSSKTTKKSSSVLPESSIAVSTLLSADIISTLLSLIPGLISWGITIAFLVAYVSVTLFSILAAPFILIFVFIAIIFVTRLCLPKLVPGTYPTGMNKANIAWFCHRALGRSAEIFGLLPLFQSFYVTRFLYLRALGANVPFKMHASNDIMLLDAPLITIGEGSMLGSGVAIACHSYVGDYLYLAPVTLGKNVFVGANTAIGPGASLGNNCWVGYGNFIFDNKIPENTRIKAFELKYKEEAYQDKTEKN